MITYTSVHVKALLNETWLARSGLPLPTETLTLLWSFIVSIYGLGGFLGSMASGYLTQRYGKKKCLLGNNVVMLMSAFLMGFSKMASSFEMILAGRFLCGISAGLCIPLHPQYLGEISPKKLRGFTSSTASVFWSLGKAFGQILGQRELLGSASLWPLLMAFSGFTAAIQLLTLPFFPESPPHLLLHKGDEQGCLKAMKILWGEGHHQAELEDLRKELATLKGTRSSSVWEVVKDPSLRWQVYTLLLLVITMQLSGINAIYFYTFEVLQTAGFDKDHIPYLSLGVSLCELLAAVMCSFIIERSGRKKLLWGGYWLMATVLAMVTLTLSLQRWVPWMPYCSLALLFCFVMCFAMGPAGATVSVRMEIFDQSSRSSAFVINGTLNWIGMFVIGMAFPFVVESLRQFSFLIFMVALYTSGLLIYLFLPETKNKSILEIREEFEKLNFKKKQVLVLERNVTEERAFCTKL
ncbi:solute carrier family 2, facilitated glucose transporter member 11-like isoform X2 [Hemicordylus capensis]|nr:solute carrier family 2, facilitated glucose transporter member 11-like isoform X2 [Hemicordylus capensis]